MSLAWATVSHGCGGTSRWDGMAGQGHSRTVASLVVCGACSAMHGPTGCLGLDSAIGLAIGGFLAIGLVPSLAAAQGGPEDEPMPPSLPSDRSPPPVAPPPPPSVPPVVNTLPPAGAPPPSVPPPAAYDEPRTSANGSPVLNDDGHRGHARARRFRPGTAPRPTATCRRSPGRSAFIASRQRRSARPTTCASRCTVSSSRRAASWSTRTPTGACSGTSRSATRFTGTWSSSARC